MIGTTTKKKAELTSRDMSTVCYHVLRKRPDFKAEKSDLEKLFLSRGHLLISSPKCHPELAGQGIEYHWGASKLYYRRHDDCVPKNFHKNVMAALNILTRRHCFFFDRRARAYRHALKDPSNSTFDKIEACVKTYKAHRNAVDFDSSFIMSVLGDELVV